MRICATSSTFVTTIATVVVNATLLIRCPLMAVMVKKFSPLAPSAKVPAVCCPLSSVTTKLTEPAVAASMLTINEAKVAPGISIVKFVKVPSAASIRAWPFAGAIRASLDEKRTEKPVWLVVPNIGLPVSPVLSSTFSSGCGLLPTAIMMSARADPMEARPISRATDKQKISFLRGIEEILLVLNVLVALRWQHSRTRAAKLRRQSDDAAGQATQSSETLKNGET